MVEDLAALVGTETPSHDLAAVARGLAAVSALAADLLGDPGALVAGEGRDHWLLGPERPRVLLVGHVDTVWPLGTTARWPFVVADGVATGPGVFDMKSGIVSALHALSVVPDRSEVAFLVTTDEETGSATSRALIERVAAGAEAALVLEPSAGGAVKTARKGVSIYRLEVSGRAAHAGLEPHKGANATLALADLARAVATLGRPDVGTTVTPTSMAAGTTTNTVPAFGHLDVDVRCAEAAEQDRVDAAIRALETTVPGTTVAVRGGPNRPPFPRSMAADLYARARRAAEALGLGDLAEIAVGGGSDGNVTAALGVPTLDGLGPVGDGAHAEGESVVVASIPERAALLAALVAELVSA